MKYFWFVANYSQGLSFGFVIVSFYMIPNKFTFPYSKLAYLFGGN